MNYLSTILPIVAIALIAFFKAVADTSADHYDTSVFKWWDRRFWDKTTASDWAPFIKFTKFRFDAWHISNFFWIAVALAAIVFSHHWAKWWYGGLVFIATGIFFNIVFNLFYNRILRRK